jgi:hypothetical protein
VADPDRQGSPAATQPRQTNTQNPLIEPLDIVDVVS